MKNIWHRSVRSDRVPHVVIKLWPGKSDDPKRRLTETITQCHGRPRLSWRRRVGCHRGGRPDEWVSPVHEPDILAKWDNLTKHPGYGTCPKA
jgi:4-oxalocrotonate tautomerase